MRRDLLLVLELLADVLGGPLLERQRGETAQVIDGGLQPVQLCRLSSQGVANPLQLAARAASP